MEGELYKIAHEHGYHVNSKNLLYKRGAAYNLAKKMEVAAAILATPVAVEDEAAALVWAAAKPRHAQRIYHQ